jgi:hypothetical protein
MKDEEQSYQLRSRGDRTPTAETLQRIAAHPLIPAAFEQCIEDNVGASPYGIGLVLKEGSREDIRSEIADLRAPALSSRVPLTPRFRRISSTAR